MNIADVTALFPLIIITATSVMLMIVIAFSRNHTLTATLTLAGLAIAAGSLTRVACMPPREVTPLFLIDPYALFFMGLILLSAFAVAALSHAYLELHMGHREEFYVLLLVATPGCSVLAAAAHFAAFFLGIELLSVSLYALAAYQRHSDRSMESGVKYLILAAVSSAFILFGMALVYAETGSMKFDEIARAVAALHGLSFLAGMVMIIVGLGFKLAVVPFHLWTPDVYEGAPAPVTAFIATASKGAVFALVFRYFSKIDVHGSSALLVVVTIISVASMFAGNLLALLQTNVKRILAYSSISHLGYLLVTVLAGGSMALSAAAFYLVAYFITTLGAFGVVAVLSTGDRDADQMNDYEGLAWKRPWLTGALTAMLLSLAGIPLTAGFVGKFYIVAAGVGSALWLVVITLVINSVIGLFYYLRIIVALFTQPREEAPAPMRTSLLGCAVLAVLTVSLVSLGVYPGRMIELIKSSMQSLL